MVQTTNIVSANSQNFSLSATNFSWGDSVAGVCERGIHVRSARLLAFSHLESDGVEMKKIYDNLGLICAALIVGWFLLLGAASVYCLYEMLKTH